MESVTSPTSVSNPPSKTRLPKFYRRPALIKMGGLIHYLPLLEIIENYHFINTAQIIALKLSGKNRTYIKLRNLYHSGFIARYVLPTTDPLLTGTSKIIYVLEKKGAAALKKFLPGKYERVYCPKRRRSFFCVEHALMVTNFRVCLTLALKNSAAVLANWKQGYALDQWLTAYRDEQNKKILPDAYFVIKHGSKELHYFLEADQSTMPLKRFAEKIEAYRLFFRIHRRNLPARFRVATIAPSDQRAENLRKLIIQQNDNQTGSERFLFTTEKNYKLEHPGKILAAIWKVGLKNQANLEALF